MSQYQIPAGGPFDPLPYNSGVYQPKPRPTSVTVISIFAIVLGSLGLLCGAIGLIIQVMMLASGGRNPFMSSAPPMTDTAMTAYGTVSSVISILIAAGFLAAGIGGLKLWPLARRGLVALSIFVLFFATLTLIVQLVWIGPRTEEYSKSLQRHLRQPTMSPAYEQGRKIGQVIGAFIGWVIWCALPVCVLIFWRSPNVIAAFEGGSLPPPSSGPGSMWPPSPAPPPGFR